MVPVMPVMGVGVMVGVGVAVGNGVAVAVAVGAAVAVPASVVTAAAGEATMVVAPPGVGDGPACSGVAVCVAASVGTSSLPLAGGPPKAPLDGVSVVRSSVLLASVWGWVAGTAVSGTVPIAPVLAEVGSAAISAVGVVAAVDASLLIGTPAKKKPSIKMRLASA